MKKKKPKLNKRPQEPTKLRIDGNTVARNPKEKEILCHCLIHLIPQLKYMSIEAIQQWLLDSVTLAYERQLHHYRIQRMIVSIQKITERENIIRKACDLMLSSEGMGTLHGFGLKVPGKAKVRVNPERMSVYEAMKQI